jgi:hypothetical protein
VVRQGVREAHRRLRQSIPAYILEGSFLSLLTAPVIYSLLLPFVILDVWVTLYQSICFPIYGMARVPRRRYFAIDRHKLAYLNGIEKVNCTVAATPMACSRTPARWAPAPSSTGARSSTLELSQLRIRAITCFSITVTHLAIERSYRLCDMP